ncbi:NADH-dependent flavin oxidoreductase [Boletus edulis]|uniref:Uncharacterized protein n=1 Tax=Boletus edulis BED1 TaxID=1328754 RepID=A0AAD4BR03_BOLED|nr:NADH-dependent flavin oxidoreductase [Boletus edulis]KAF8438008.1 hypothetical protein L210DRAFT_959292 [Boletus edulis BED1]
MPLFLRVSATEWLEEALPDEPSWRVEDTLVVGPVGSITNGVVTQGVLDRGQADVVLVGRFFKKNPAAVWSFASDLGVEIKVANQIEWGFLNRGGTRQENRL